MLSPARAAALRPPLDRLYRACAGPAAPATPSTASVSTPRRPTARSPGSWPQAWRSAASPSILSSIGAALAPHGPVAGGLRARLRAGPRCRPVPAVRPSLDARARHRRPAGDPAAHARHRGVAGAVLPRRRRPGLAGHRPGAGVVRGARASRGPAARLRPPPRTPGVHALLPAALGRQRLQAAEPVPALDGPARRHRPRRLDARLAGAADRAARRARDPRGPVPRADDGTPRRAGAWRRPSPRPCARSIPRIPCATTSRCVTWGC